MRFQAYQVRNAYRWAVATTSTELKTTENARKKLLVQAYRLADLDSEYQVTWRLLLRYGRFFTRPNVLARSSPYRGRHATSRAVAAAVAVDHSELAYAEGVATVSEEHLVRHRAWNITASGVAVDYTTTTPGKAYLGVPFTSAYLSKARYADGSPFSVWDQRIAARFLEEGLPSSLLLDVGSGVPVDWLDALAERLGHVSDASIRSGGSHEG